jgi:hypothetical protein
MEITEDNIDKMRRVARRKARKCARGHDDLDAAAEDMEQDGWEAFLRAEAVGHDVEHCWFRAFSRMAETYFRWRFGRRYGAEDMTIQGVDFSLLATLDPSVEDYVLGCELMRGFEAEFRKLKHTDKSPEELKNMILAGNPWGGQRVGKRGNEYNRRRRIKQILSRLLDRPTDLVGTS